MSVGGMVCVLTDKVDYRGLGAGSLPTDTVNRHAPLFCRDPFPRDRDEYLLWIQRNLEFVEKRNRRIEAFLGS